MKMKSMIAFALLLRSCTACSKDVVLDYSEMRFHIPDGYSVIISTDLMNGMLAFKYDAEKGKKFLAFSDVTNDSSIDYGCSPGEFYVELFEPTGATKCNKRALDAATKGLLNEGVAKTWKTSNIIIYYLKFKEGPESLAFVCKKDGRTVQVDSSFLTENDFRKMFEEILIDKI